MNIIKSETSPNPPLTTPPNLWGFIGIRRPRKVDDRTNQTSPKAKVLEDFILNKNLCVTL